MSTGDSQLLRECFDAFNTTLRGIHSIFFRMVLLQILVMAMTALFMYMEGQKSENRLMRRMETIPSDVARVVNIQLNQHVDVKEDSKQDAIMRIVEDRHREKLEKERADADRLRTR